MNANVGSIKLQDAVDHLITAIPVIPKNDDNIQVIVRKLPYAMIHGRLEVEQNKDIKCHTIVTLLKFDDIHFDYLTETTIMQ